MLIVVVASAGELSLFKSPSYNLLCEQMEYTRAHKGISTRHLLLIFLFFSHLLLVHVEDTNLPVTPSPVKRLKHLDNLIIDSSKFTVVTLSRFVFFSVCVRDFIF